MTKYKITIDVDGKIVETLSDILPDKPGLKILLIAKTPALKSVNKGHYFQGSQGRAFWNRLAEYKILNVPFGKHEDEYLLDKSIGITDIVKVPRNFGDEPSDMEYRLGLQRILDLINLHKPKVIVFVYKKVLDNILKFGFNIIDKSSYGFNPDFEQNFNSKVFVFPMPGTPCKREQAIEAMEELQKLIFDQDKN